MGSRKVVIGHISKQKLAQVPLAEDDDIIVTDKLRSYGAALREIGFSGSPKQGLRGDRAENSHQPIRRRERERKMQGFKSAKSAQRFVSVHAAVYNTFNVPRHLMTRTKCSWFRLYAHTY